MRAILRRVTSNRDNGPADPIVAGPLTVLPGKRRAEWYGAALDLTGTEFSLLEELARNAGHIVGKEQLSRNALGRALSAYDRRIDVHISSIRQKLGPRPDGQPWILGIRGQGYQLACE